MRKILSLFIVLSLLAIGPVQAQNSKAKSIMHKLSAKLKHAKAISAKFSITSANAGGISQSGSVRMKGNQYKVILKGGQQILCDGHTVWTYLPKNKAVQIVDYNPATQPISPSSLFSGSYEKDYHYKYSGTKTINGKRVYVIMLTPKEQKSFSKVNLYVNTGNDMISGGKVFTSGGGAYLYKISDVNTKAHFSDATFKFDPKAHPGLDVIDLR